jgi:polyhydroxybutyrate depolymerase
MAPSPSAGPGDHRFRLTVAGTNRRYLVHAPPACTGGHPLPAVLMLPGMGATARWTLTETGWADKADQEGFLAVVPEGMPLDPSRPAHFWTNPLLWNAGGDFGPADRRAVHDVAFLKAVIDDVTAHFPVDPGRVFVTGFSNGAAMVFLLGAMLSSRLAAIAPVAGFCRVADPRPEPPLPTLYLVGTADPLVPLQGGEAISPWGGRIHRPPVVEMLAEWANGLGCAAEPTVRRAAGGVEAWAYGGCRGGVDFLAYFIDGLGHHWPGGQGRLAAHIAGQPRATPRATDLIWDFFRASSPRPGS